MVWLASPTTQTSSRSPSQPESNRSWAGVMSWYSSTVNQRYCERIMSAMSGRSPIRATMSSRTSSKSMAPASDFTSW